MEPTDEMVEAALDRWFRNGWRKDHPMAAEWVVNMRSAIRAALAVMPDRHRAGWIACRDAAADILDQHIKKIGPPFVRETDPALVSIHFMIRNMEPPT